MTKKTYVDEKPLWKKMIIITDKLSRTKDPGRRANLEAGRLDKLQEIDALHQERIEDDDST